MTRCTSRSAGTAASTSSRNLRNSIAPLIRNWFNRHPRWHAHLTPTSASWLNQVERFFALLSERQLRRGIHRSVVALKTAITTFIEQHNANPKPFRWTKSADDILTSIERFCVYNTQAKA